MVFIVHDVCDILCDVGEATRKTCGWPLWFLGSLSAAKKMYLRQTLEPIGHGTQI